jgi:hypothetical protein
MLQLYFQQAGCAIQEKEMTQRLLENADVLWVLQKYAPRETKSLGLQVFSQITNALNDKLESEKVVYRAQAEISPGRTAPDFSTEVAHRAWNAGWRAGSNSSQGLLSLRMISLTDQHGTIFTALCEAAWSAIDKEGRTIVLTLHEAVCAKCEEPLRQGHQCKVA